MKTGNRNSWKATLLGQIVLSTMVIFGLLAIVGTGGGGGGGGSSSASLTYTGLTSQALIDTSNAQTLADGVYSGGVVGTEMTGFGAVQDYGTGQGDMRLFTTEKALESALLQIDFVSRSYGTYQGAVYNDSVTLPPGSCGGSASYTISIDDQTGAFSGTFIFNNYCDGDVTFTGTVGFSGNVDLGTGYLLNFNFTFNSLTGIILGESITLDGTIAIVVNVSPMTITMNVLMRDNGTGKVYRFDNFTMTILDGGSYVDVTVTGRYYDPDYGYVDISSPTPLRIYNVDDWPSAGMIELDGATGIGGFSTKARLTAIDNLTCRVQADTNGDDDYDDVDDYDSGVINWTAL